MDDINMDQSFRSMNLADGVNKYGYQRTCTPEFLNVYVRKHAAEKRQKKKKEMYRGEWGEMAVGQNAQIDFVCYSIALAT